MVINKDYTVEYRTVIPGPFIEGLRVIKEGLKPDDWVIVNGLQRVQPGTKVNPEKVDMASLAVGNAAAAAKEKPQPKKQEAGARQ